MVWRSVDSNLEIEVIADPGRQANRNHSELNSEPRVALDLGEVSLVDVDVVRFLGAWQVKGAKLTGCSPYIRHWIAIELEREH